MGSYNPNYPTVLGNELAPVALDPLAIDTATAFGYTFVSAEADELQTARVLLNQPPPGQPRRRVISWEMYGALDAPGTGPLGKIVVPCSSGANVTGTSLVFAASYEEAMANPTDGAGVWMTGPSASFRLWFDTSTSNVRLTDLLLNRRIIDVSVLYATSGRYAGEYETPMVLSLERPSASDVFDMDSNIKGAVGLGENVVQRRVRLGDFNPFWNTTIDPNSDPRRAPWKHQDGANNHTGLESMSASGGTNINLRWTASADVPSGDVAFAIHYCALEITYAAEGRLAAGAYDLFGGVELDAGMFYIDVPVFGTTNYGFDFSTSAGYEYLMVVGQGYVGAGSVTYPVPVTVPRLRPARDTFRGHRGVLLRKTLTAGREWTREDTDAIPAVVLYESTSVFDSTTIYPPSQVYPAQQVTPVANLTFPGEAYARLIDDEAGREYTHVRFYARRYPSTIDDLRVYVADSSTDAYVGPEATITLDAFDALPEIANGWKEVTLELSAAWTSTGAGVVQLQFDSATDSAFPWELLGADANPYDETAGAYGSATYGGTTAYVTAEDTQDLNADMSVVLVQALPVPGDLQVAGAVQDLALLDEYCGVPLDAMPTGIRYHELTWEPVNDLSVAGFAYYEVQRRDTTMAAGEWETVAEVTDVATTAMDDYEARVGVESTYRVRTVHEDGYTSAWSDTAAATIAAPGVTGAAVDVSVLILTSNHNPAGNLAYTMAWDATSPPPQEFEFLEAGELVLQTMYGRDYQTAFRPLERGGVQFTRTLMLNAAGVPTRTLDGAAVALRDLAWDTVPYVCVRDERDNRWLTALSVPSAAARDVPVRGHLVMAPVTFTEVTATPAPVDYEPGCQGLRLEGVSAYQVWRAEAPAALAGTRVITDTYSRSVASGWGSTDTGQVWVASGTGAASDFNVAAGVGTINSTNTLPVERRQLMVDSYGYHRTKVKVTIPAVATGGAFHFGVLTRYQDFNNYYYIRVRCQTSGQFHLQVVQVASGSATTIHSSADIASYTAGTIIYLEEMTRGTNLSGRVWRDGDPVPEWDNFDDDTFYLPAETGVSQMTGRIGVMQVREAANTNANLTLEWDDFTVDDLPEVFDWRVQVRPFADTFNVSYGSDEWSGGSDSEGGWSLLLGSDHVALLYYGADSTDLYYSGSHADLGLVPNRLAWVRVVLTQDDGNGDPQAEFYRLDDDGVTWTLVDTVTQTAPAAAMPPLMPGAYVTVENYYPGGIWTLDYELRVDGTLILSPDFDGQAIGTEAFTDAQSNDWSGEEGRGICATLE